MLSAKKDYRKLNEFITKHNFLISEFEENESTENKYKILKTTINILNHHHVPQMETNKNIRKKSKYDQLMQQTQEMYFKQLNKMCEGHEIYELNKIEEQLKLRKKINSTQNIQINKKQVKPRESLPIKKEFKPFFKYRGNEKQKQRKFIELPDFGEILSGCALAYSKQTQAHQLGRKIKRMKQYMQKGRIRNDNSQENQYKHRKWAKNQMLKAEIQELKKKAKDQFDLNFDGLTKERFSQKCQQKNQATEFNCDNSLNYQQYSAIRTCTLPKDKETQHKKQQLLEKSSSNEENYYIPHNFLKSKQKSRPNSVCASPFKLRKSLHNRSHYMSYLRV